MPTAEEVAQAEAIRAAAFAAAGAIDYSKKSTVPTAADDYHAPTGDVIGIPAGMTINSQGQMVAIGSLEYDPGISQYVPVGTPLSPTPTGDPNAIVDWSAIGTPPLAVESGGTGASVPGSSGYVIPTGTVQTQSGITIPSGYARYTLDPSTNSYVPSTQTPTGTPVEITSGGTLSGSDKYMSAAESEAFSPFSPGGTTITPSEQAAVIGSYTGSAGQQNTSMGAGMVAALGYNPLTVSQQYAQKSNMNSAYGIAVAAATNFAVLDLPTAQLAIQEGYRGSIYSYNPINKSPDNPLGITMNNPIAGTSQYVNLSLPTGVNTVPVYSLSDSLTRSNQPFVPAVYNPNPVGVVDLIGSFGSVKRIDQATVGVDALTGEIAVYTQDYHGHWGLSGGVSRYGAQSGEFIVTAPDQSMAMNLDVVSPFWTENLTKLEAPGAAIPWNINQNYPALFSMNENGVGQELSFASGRVVASPMNLGAPVTQKIVAPSPMMVETGAGGGVGKQLSNTGLYFTPLPVGTQIMNAGGANITGGQSYPGIIGSIFGSPEPTTTVSGATANYQPPALFQVFAAGGDNILSMGKMVGLPAWTPFADLNRATGNTWIDAQLTTTRQERASVLSQITTSPDLTTWGANLNKTASANINSAGFWSKDQASLDVFNADVAAYNTERTRQSELYTSLNQIDQRAYESGAYIIKNGQFVENPDMLHPYGLGSEWGQGAAKVLQGWIGITPAQFEMETQRRNAIPLDRSTGLGWVEGNTPQDVSNFIFGFNKELYTNPFGLASSAASGVILYAATAGAGAVVSGIAPSVASVAGGTGMLATGARTTLAIAPYANVALTYGVPAVFVGSGIGEATEWGKAPASQSAMNLGAGGAHLAAMTYGAVGAGYVVNPEPLMMTYEAMFNEKTGQFRLRSDTQWKIQESQYKIDTPNVMLPGGEERAMQINVQQSYLSQPSMRIPGLDIEVKLPRLFEPKVRYSETFNYEVSGIAKQQMVNDRFAGAQVNPVTGARTITTTISTFEDMWHLPENTARVSGTLSAGRVELPASYNDYLAFGAREVRSGNYPGMTQEGIAELLMARDVVSGASRQMIYRTLDSTVFRSDITPENMLNLHNWNAAQLTGTPYEMGRVNVLDYVGQFKMSYESSRGGNYRIEVTPDTIGGVLVKSGEVNIYGARTAEATLINNALDLSREMRKSPILIGEREIGVSWNWQSGTDIARTVGDYGSVHMTPVIDAATPYIESGGSIALGHSHPAYTSSHLISRTIESFVRDVFDPYQYRTSDPFFRTQKRIDFIRNSETVMRDPSINPGNPNRPYTQSYRGDFDAFQYQSQEFVGTSPIEAQIIMTETGITIIRRPPEDIGGWLALDRVAKEVGAPASSPSTNAYATYERDLQSAYKKFGIESQFVPNTEEYIPIRGQSSMTINAPAEMNRILSERGLQTRFIDMLDRDILHNENYEFIREPPQPSLLGNRNNLGGTLNGLQRRGISEYEDATRFQYSERSLVDRRQRDISQRQFDQEIQQNFEQQQKRTVPAQPYKGGKETVTATNPGYDPFRESPVNFGNNFGGYSTKVYPIRSSQQGQSLINPTEQVTAFSPAQAQMPSQIQQPLSLSEQRVGVGIPPMIKPGVETIFAYSPLQSTFPVIEQQQRQNKENVLAVMPMVNSRVGQSFIQNQINEQMPVFKQATRQAQVPIQNTSQITQQIQQQIQQQIKPKPPIPDLPIIPPLPGPVPSGAPSQPTYWWRGVRSQTGTNAVGADLLGKSRGSFTPMPMGKGRKMKMPKFKMPKF